MRIVHAASTSSAEVARKAALLIAPWQSSQGPFQLKPQHQDIPL
jgi:hypothetical protein